MYGYSIPYKQIPNFPAEIALKILLDSSMGTKWTRVVDGVYSYMEAILASLRGTVRTGIQIQNIWRNENGVKVELATWETHDFDKLIFACPPDQVLKLLADPSPEETTRFGAWQENHAVTLIHHDTSFYELYGITAYNEFDVFEKSNGDAGYNAYLNRLVGLPESSPHQYHLAYNLSDRIEPAKVIQRQEHFVPLYSAEALKYRPIVHATNGENHTYHAGAWMDNGLHEGAVNSAIGVARLLDGDVSGFTKITAW